MRNLIQLKETELHEINLQHRSVTHDLEETKRLVTVLKQENENLMNKQQQNIGLEHQIHILEKNNTNLQQQVTDLTKQYTDTQTETQTLNNELQQLRAVQVTIKLSEVQTLAKYEEQEIALIQKLNVANDRIALLEQSIQNQQQKDAKWEQKQHNWKQMELQYQTSIQQLKQDIQAKQLTYDTLNGKYNEMDIRMSTRLQSEQSRIVTLEQQIQEWDSKYHTLHSTHSSFTNKIQSLQFQLHEITTSYDTIQQLCKTLQQENKYLHSYMDLAKSIVSDPTVSINQPSTYELQQQRQQLLQYQQAANTLHRQQQQQQQQSTNNARMPTTDSNASGTTSPLLDYLDNFSTQAINRLRSDYDAERHTLLQQIQELQHTVHVLQQQTAQNTHISNIQSRCDTFCEHERKFPLKYQHSHENHNLNKSDSHELQTLLIHERNMITQIYHDQTLNNHNNSSSFFLSSFSTLLSSLSPIANHIPTDAESDVITCLYTLLHYIIHILSSLSKVTQSNVDSIQVSTIHPSLQLLRTLYHHVEALQQSGLEIRKCLRNMVKYHFVLIFIVLCCYCRFH